jgi:hypothetical protein
VYPVFYLIEALLSVIDSHDILEKNIGFIPRNFQVTIALGICKHSLLFLRAVILCCPSQVPHEQMEGVVAHLFPALGVPVSYRTWRT